MLASIRHLFRQPVPIPLEHRRNIRLLYWDVAFWGILNGSIIVFLAVYASRLGASPLQTGLLTASPALMNLIFTFPASNYARGKSHYKITRLAHLITRLFYGLLIPLPVLVAAQAQIWIIIGITLAMNVSGTFASVIGNAFFAETVPDEVRGQVVGNRNALLALTTMVTTFVVGQILRLLPFETGYQVIFSIGFVGSMASIVMLFLVRPVVSGAPPPALPKTGLRLDILRSRYNRVLLAMFAYHMAVFIPNPIFPLYQVNELKMSDQLISYGSSLFWVVYFLGSTQGGSLARRLGFKRLTGVGVLVASFSTLLFTFSYQPWIYIVTQLFGGIGWSMIGSGLINYVLEFAPADDRPAHLAWFNLVANSAVLICGLIASPIGNSLGLFGAMVLAIIVRVLAGIAILKWG
jgi:MFS family permease